MNAVLQSTGHRLLGLLADAREAAAPLWRAAGSAVPYIPAFILAFAAVLLVQPALALRRLQRSVLPWALPGSAAARRRRAWPHVSMRSLAAAVTAQRGPLIAAMGVGALAATASHRAALALPAAMVTLAGGTAVARAARKAASGRQARRVRHELASVIDFLALTASAGLSVEASLERVPGYFTGVIAESITASAARGASALDGLAEVSAVSDDVRGLVDALIVCQATGAPVAQVLHEQAAAAQARVRSDALAAAGRREVLMLIPVVFLVFPAVVLVAVFPGWQELRGIGW
ncbi:MAG: type II secretion system F family protein [Actinomycetales bacterium]|nr:type II secretion system F family protein [Actinomycetales bacterium]